METAESILEKHWINYRVSIGLEYEPMSEKAKEYFIMAMKEFAKLTDQPAPTN
jgi:hypothetical protein